MSIVLMGQDRRLRGSGASGQLPDPTRPLVAKGGRTPDVRTRRLRPGGGHLIETSERMTYGPTRAGFDPHLGVVQVVDDVTPEAPGRQSHVIANHLGLPLLTLAVLAAVSFTSIASAPVVRADACLTVMPSAVGAARGTTFTGTLTHQKADGHGTFAFVVDRVYANALGPDGPVRGQHMTLSSRCAPLGHLRTGHRYLVSSSGLASTASSMATVVWEVRSDDTVRLVASHGLSAGPQAMSDRRSPSLDC